MCPGHETDGEFAGESGNLYREWWQTENLRLSLILQIVENQRSKLGNKKAERGVRPAKRQKNGGKDRSRTGDTRIFSPLLYQLSYPATSSNWSMQLIYYSFGKNQVEKAKKIIFSIKFRKSENRNQNKPRRFNSSNSTRRFGVHSKRQDVNSSRVKKRTSSISER